MERYVFKYDEMDQYSKEDLMVIFDTVCRYANSKLTYMGAEDVLAMIGIDRVDGAKEDE